jgi:hypothetical protein
MAQPTITGVTLNAGSGGSDLAVDVVDSKLWQAILVGYSTGDGTANVVMADTGLPVVAATGATWAATQSGTWNITNISGTVSLPTGAATEETLSTLSGKVTACDTGAVVVSSGTITSITNSVAVAGVAAENEAVSGNPVLVAGRYDSATRILNSGDVGALALNANGAVKAELTGTSNVQVTNAYHRIIGNETEDGAVAFDPLLVAGRYDSSPRTLDNGDAGAIALSAAGAVMTAQSGSWTVAVSSGTITTVSRVTEIANALPAGDNNIGNVDIVSLPSGNLGQQAMAASLSVVPASNITDATYIGDIKFGEALPEGSNAIGKLAANSGVDIGDVDVTSLPATPAGTNLIGKVSAGLDGTNLYDGTTALTLKRATGIATDSGANTMISAVADKQIRVLALALFATSTTAVAAYIYNGDYMLLGDGTNKLQLDADGGGGPAGFVLPFNPGGWCQTDADNEALAINLSAATPVIWAVTYVEV